MIFPRFSLRKKKFQIQVVNLFTDAPLKDNKCCCKLPIETLVGVSFYKVASYQIVNEASDVERCYLYTRHISFPVLTAPPCVKFQPPSVFYCFVFFSVQLEICLCLNQLLSPNLMNDKMNGVLQIIRITLA